MHWSYVDKNVIFGFSVKFPIFYVFQVFFTKAKNSNGVYSHVNGFYARLILKRTTYYAQLILKRLQNTLDLFSRDCKIHSIDSHENTKLRSIDSQEKVFYARLILMFELFSTLCSIDSHEKPSCKSSNLVNLIKK